MDRSVAPSTSSPERPLPGPGRPWLRAAVIGLALLILLMVFAAYLQPSMAFQLAQQLWACF